MFSLKLKTVNAVQTSIFFYSPFLTNLCFPGSSRGAGGDDAERDSRERGETAGPRRSIISSIRYVPVLTQSYIQNSTYKLVEDF